MKKQSARSLSTVMVMVIAVLAMAISAHAIPIQYSISYTGAGFGNGATASGYVTFESTLLPNPTGTSGVTDILSIGPGQPVIDLKLTVTGAADPNANNTFGMSDFSAVLWYTHGNTLNLNQSIFTQNIVDNSIPTSFTFGTQGVAYLAGDFGLLGFSAYAPSSSNYFELQAYGGESMGMEKMDPVPEPATIFLLGSGALAVGMRRMLARKAVAA